MSKTLFGGFKNFNLVSNKFFSHSKKIEIYFLDRVYKMLRSISDCLFPYDPYSLETVMSVILNVLLIDNEYTPPKLFNDVAKILEEVDELELSNAKKRKIVKKRLQVITDYFEGIFEDLKGFVALEKDFDKIYPPDSFKNEKDRHKYLMDFLDETKEVDKT